MAINFQYHKIQANINSLLSDSPALTKKSFFLNQKGCCELMLDLEYTPDLKLFANITASAEDTANIVKAFNRSTKSLKPSTIIYL